MRKRLVYCNIGGVLKAKKNTTKKKYAFITHGALSSVNLTMFTCYIQHYVSIHAVLWKVQVQRYKSWPKPANTWSILLETELLSQLPPFRCMNFLYHLSHVSHEFTICPVLRFSFPRMSFGDIQSTFSPGRWWTVLVHPVCTSFVHL